MLRTLRTLHIILLLACNCPAAWSAEPVDPGPLPAARVPLPTAATTPAAPPVAASDAPAVPAVPSPDATVAAAPAEPPATLDARVQELKNDVIQLNRDLLVLEEELLFPANTQVALFVSMDIGVMFDLESVQVKIDDTLVATYLYTPMEVKALQRGGVQRLYVGNLRTGRHELVAFFTGQGPHTRDYKRGATVVFDKDTQAKYAELRIRDSSAKLQPEFDIKLWD